VVRTSICTPEDPYEILQVSPHASEDVIRAAYRVLARNYHPDVSDSPVAALRMQELNAAYKALMDPQRRAQFDAQVPIGRARAAASRRLNAPPRVRTEHRDGLAERPRLSRPLVLAVSLGVFIVLAVAFIFAVSFAIDALDAPVSGLEIGQAVSF
jgi:DnaJ domain